MPDTYTKEQIEKEPNFIPDRIYVSGNLYVRCTGKAMLTPHHKSWHFPGVVVSGLGDVEEIERPGYFNSGWWCNVFSETDMVHISALSTAEQERDECERQYQIKVDDYAEILDRAEKAESERDALQSRCAELEARLQGMGWISVEERLPEKDGSYLVWAPQSFPKNSMCVVAEFYDDNNTFYSESSDYAMKDVTHWMPLPEPPILGEKKED